MKVSGGNSDAVRSDSCHSAHSFVGLAMRILVVEDERKVARFLERGLREERFAVDIAGDGEEGLFKAQTNDYDLIVLDLLLPKKDGLQVLCEIRQSVADARVLLLTARDSVQDRVRGLDLGADDYLVKPFAFSELLARIRALLRRGQDMQPARVQIADLSVDLRARRVSRAGRPALLTTKEFAVLEYLLSHREQVVTRTELSEHVWDEQFDSFSNLIDVTIYHLREKIDRDYKPQLIHTVRGAGYVLRLPEER
jgi:heavy metal response regulator